VAKKKHSRQRLKRRPAWLTNERDRITEPWRLAIFKLRDQLGDDCLSRTAERRRLQNRRLIDNLCDEFGPSPKLPECDMMAYWLFCGSPWQDQLGYDAARQQHYAELKALGLSRELQRSMPRTKTQVNAFVIELLFRLDSLASWIEAQESWIFGGDFATTLLYGIAMTRARGCKPSVRVSLLGCRRCLTAYRIGSSLKSSAISEAGPSRNGSRF
jgi:hypothetical protein